MRLKETSVGFSGIVVGVSGRCRFVLVWFVCNFCGCFGMVLVCFDVSGSLVKSGFGCLVCQFICVLVLVQFFVLQMFFIYLCLLQGQKTHQPNTRRNNLEFDFGLYNLVQSRTCLSKWVWYYVRTR